MYGRTLSIVFIATPSSKYYAVQDTVVAVRAKSICGVHVLLIGQPVVMFLFKSIASV